MLAILTLDVLGRDNVFPLTPILGESMAQARSAAERCLATTPRHHQEESGA